LRGNQFARSGSPVTSSQVEHIAIITLIGDVTGLGLGFAIKSSRIKV
jgi:S1-C subfamily serine protease